jgi:hypothetical protein
MTPSRLAMQEKDYSDPQDGGSKLLQNIYTYLPIDTTSYPKTL